MSQILLEQITSIQEYDIFHFHGDNGFIRCEYANRSVLTLHGIASSTSSFAKKFVTTLPSRIERNNAKLARKVFSISSEAAIFFERYSKYPIQVIKQSIDTDFYKPTSLAHRHYYRKIFGLSDTDIVGIIVGTDPVRKGLHIAIRAVEMLVESNIVLFAIGFPKIVTKNKKIRNFGKVDEATKLRCLQIADFFIFPSQKEGFPLSVLEAASVGKPLIVSKNSNVSELGNFVTYFDEIDSFNPLDYKIGIEKFIQDYVKSTHDHTLNRKDFLDQYSLTSMVRKYYDVYSNEIMVDDWNNFSSKQSSQS